MDERGVYVDTVQTSDIPEIIEDARDALDFYFKYKRFGNPFSRGWTEWPEYAVDIIELYDSIDWTKKDD